MSRTVSSTRGTPPHQWDVFDGPSATNSQGGHTYLEDTITPLTLTLFVTDTDPVNGGFGSASGSLTVADAPLTAGPSITISPVEGIAFNGTVATFTDQDPSGNASEYVATISWGDGATSAATISAGPTVSTPDGPRTQFIVQANHTYAEEGSYPSFDPKGKQLNLPVTVTITDTDGHTPPQGTRATTAVNDTAVVRDAPLSPAAIQIPFSAVEGNSSSGVVASFVDTNPNAVVSDHSGTIDWGDGSTSSFTSASVQFVFNFVRGGGVQHLRHPHLRRRGD